MLRHSEGILQPVHIPAGQMLPEESKGRHGIFFSGWVWSVWDVVWVQMARIIKDFINDGKEILKNRKLFNPNI